MAKVADGDRGLRGRNFPLWRQKRGRSPLGALAPLIGDLKGQVAPL